jgi:hypothetical protein
LLPLIKIGELPTVELPVKTGTVPVVPPGVVTVVCAIAPIAITAIASQVSFRCVLIDLLPPLVSIVTSFTTKPKSYAFSHLRQLPPHRSIAREHLSNAWCSFKLGLIAKSFR